MEKGSEDVKLLGFWASPFVLRARIALNIKGVPYEFVEEDKTSKIPTLLHAGHAICEPFNIVEYLDATWKAVDSPPPILPADPYNRTIERFWATHIDDKLASAMKLMIKGSTEDVVALHVEEEFRAAMLILESAFKNGSQGKSFFGKDNIGYIDISLGSMLGWLKAAEKSKNLKLLDVEKTPLLASWAERFQAHGSVKGMIPEPYKLFELDDKIIGGSQEKEETEAYLYTMQLCSGSVLPMTLKAAIELGVLDVIVRAGSRKFLSTKEIEDELSIVNPDAPTMLDRILRCLACHNILTCKFKSDGENDHEGTLVSRLYGVAHVCKYFVRNEDGVSLGPFLLMLQDEVYMKSRYYLKDVVMNGGIPFDMA